MTRTGTRKLALAIGVVVAAAGIGAYAVLAASRPAAVSARRPRSARFFVSGNLGRPLTPGLSRSLNLRLTNRYRFGLWITRLKVRLTVDSGHVRSGCAARANFTLRQLPRAVFPIRMRRRRARTLRALGIRRLPQVGMRDLPATDQDACKGAVLRLRYAATARRHPPMRISARWVPTPKSP